MNSRSAAPEGGTSGRGYNITGDDLTLAHPRAARQTWRIILRGVLTYDAATARRPRDDAAALDVLLLDREHPAAERRLSAWLGPEHARSALAECGDRFLLIFTRGIPSTPQWAHLIEFLPTADALFARVDWHLDRVELFTALAGAHRPIDFRPFLAPAERARFDQLLNEREASQLRRAVVGGRA